MKYSKAFVVIGMLLMISPVYAQNVSQTDIAALLAQIQALQAQLTTMQAPSASQPDDYGTGVRAACPKLTITMERGARDSSTNGQVSELQKFLADYYDIDPIELVTGYFGRITQGYVQQFQREQGLPTFGIAGSMTRAAIAKICGGNSTSSTGETVNPRVVSSDQIPTATVVPVGCVSTTGYSSATGQKCDGGTTTIIETKPPVVQSCPIYNACPSGYTMNTSVDANGCTKISCTLISQPAGSFTVSQTSGTAPLTVTFSGSSGQGMAGLASEVVAWIDFGDGTVDDSIGSGSFSKTHMYVSAGTYTAKLAWKNYGPASSNYPTNTVGTVTITVGGQVSAAPTIRVVSPNGGETLNAGTVTTVQWDASNIPATAYVGGSQVSYKIGLKLINPSGQVVGYIPLGSGLFDGTVRSTQWDPASLNGGFSALNQLKVRASVIKQTNQCVLPAAVAYSSLATSQIACISEETVTSDDSDGWFSVKGATVCSNAVTPMVCTQS